ncbi:sensor histidine kinase [Virgisporangium aurantiacum]|uniref:histidine kinase n=1 Tax=Virgisporangium aurantiacum TaxID=175570 RepID=A0A8J3Z9N3_9ACTN|nr:HAMP domain-containing sensor histidine kinase [Virgisporangium aurantiacum]GIJ60139.1 sensor protein CutS [Virgisporangium aurantiacum]
MKLRTRLTLLYAVPFLLSGTLLVAIPVLQSRSSSPVGSGSGPPPVEVETPTQNRILIAAVIALGLMVVVSVLAGWLVAGRFLRPLWTITATARDISASNLHRRLGHLGRDEFALLAGTLDDLFERLQAAFVSQQRFVANAAHELRTPLTAERTLLQVALADPDASVDSLRGACEEVLTLGRAQERLIDALLTLATGERGIEQREPLDLATIAAEVAADRAETTLETAPTAGDPRLVEILVANLVDNAVRYNVPGGRVGVATSTVDGRARLTVTNTGPVVPPGELARLFEPFQRLGRQRLRHPDGHGLGLAIVRAIATAHGAALTAHANPGGGLTVTVDFGP